MKQCIIVSGGEWHPLPQELQFRTEDDFIIACDSGYDHCLAWGIVPHLLVGDMDSITAQLPLDIPCMKLPREKDDTDTMTAIKQGLERGYQDFLMVGALGGRLDHTLANLQTLAYIQKAGGQGCICSDREKIFLICNQSITIPFQENTTLSIFSLDEKAEGVSITGAKYSLENAVMGNSEPIGISNEFCSGSVTIGVTEGRLLVFLSKKLA